MTRVNRSSRVQLTTSEALSAESLATLPDGPSVPTGSPLALSLAGHELCGHLTPLVLQTDLLTSGRLGPLNPAQERSVQLLSRSMERTMQLLQDILDSSRIRAGRFVLHRTDVDLHEIVQEVFHAHQDVAGRAGVTLSSTSPGPTAYRGDPGRIYQILTNLLSNALKFTPPGGTVHVALGREADGVRLEVADTGRGLSAEEIGRLFQPFAQGDAGQDARIGTGLGLYITQSLVTAHGGTIDAISAGRGHGSRFRVWLPQECA